MQTSVEEESTIDIFIIWSSSEISIPLTLHSVSSGTFSENVVF